MRSSHKSRQAARLRLMLWLPQIICFAAVAVYNFRFSQSNDHDILAIIFAVGSLLGIVLMVSLAMRKGRCKRA